VNAPILVPLSWHACCAGASPSAYYKLGFDRFDGL
jgi:hypothetical protein